MQYRFCWVKYCTIIQYCFLVGIGANLNVYGKGVADVVSVFLEFFFSDFVFTLFC